MRKRCRKAGTPHGFSLLEAIAAIAVIGILSWIVVASQSGTSRGAAIAKLDSDVASINQAIAVYLANGGSLAGLADPQAVLDKMKTSVSAEDDAKHAGFSGSMVDPRLAARMTTVNEAGSAGGRALWNSSRQRFEVATRGMGVAEFYLDDAKGTVHYGIEKRTASTLDYETGSGWIWPYQDAPEQPRSAPAVVALANPGHATPPSPGAGPVRIRLAAPAFSHAAGTYARSSFPLTVSILNPNTSGGSWIMYSLDGGSYNRYAGPVSVTRDTRLAAFVTGDPRLYFASSLTEALYAPKPPVDLAAPVVTPSHGQFLWDSVETVLVSIDNPNEPRISTLEYRIGSGEWVAYSAPIELALIEHTAGAVIAARAVPLTVDYKISPETQGAVQGPPPPVQLEAPEIRPVAPAFMAGIVEQISISLLDPNREGSALDYRLEGGEWQVYGGPFQVSRSAYAEGLVVEARARAASRAYLDSEVAAAGIGLSPVQLRAPGIAPSAPNFIASLVETVSITLTDPNGTGCQLEYRIGAGDWQSYGAPFAVSRREFGGGLALEARARATSPAYLDSDVANAAVGLTPVQLHAPVIQPSAPNFTAGTKTISVSITNPNGEGSVLEYRTAGGSWLPYTAAFDLTRAGHPEGVTIEARVRSTAPAYLDSDVSQSEVGLIPSQLQAPVIELSQPNFIPEAVESVTVKLTDSNAEGSALEYRMPSGAWTPYGEPFAVTRGAFPGGLIVEARARSAAPGYLDSGVASAEVGLTAVKLKAPAVSPSAPNFVAGSLETVTVTVTNPNAAGSALEYRLDGGGWTAYAGPFPVTRAAFPAGLRVEARARSTTPAYLTSDIASAAIGCIKRPSVFSQYCGGSLSAYSVAVFGGGVLQTTGNGNVTGDVAIGPSSSWSTSSVAGTLYAHPGLTGSGSTAVSRDLSRLQQEALALASAAAALEPTQTFARITSGITITATAASGMNVIRIDEISLANNALLTLSGGPDDYFVLNIVRSVRMTGQAGWTLSSNLDPSHVIINMLPGSTQLSATGGSDLRSGGIILAPYVSTRVDLTGTAGFQASLFARNNVRLTGGAGVKGAKCN